MDGRGAFPGYSWQAREPSESRIPCDALDPQTITPAPQARHPLDPGCAVPVTA